MNGQVPDTLLLEERADLAMNAVVGLADEHLDHIPYFNATLHASPAFLRHGSWDYGSSHGRLIDASVLARRMTGRSWWQETEQHYRRNLYAFLGEDGLSYRRTNPRGDWDANANLIDQRSTLLALTSLLLDGDDEAHLTADNHVAALKRIAIKHRDVWFYPASEYEPSGWPSSNAVRLGTAADPASFNGRLIMPLLRYHRVTGNTDALELCDWFVRLIVDHSGVFNEDGSFNGSLPYRSGHFHTRVGTLDGLARYAEFVGDHELSAFVRRSLDWALTQSTAFGWTPGDLTHQRFEHETCSLVDLISLTTTLARMGSTGLWSVAERFLRNHLVESQLLDLSWVESAPDRSQDEPGWATYYEVGERVRGAFAGYGAPNDFVADVELGRGHTSDVQACCVGAGLRGLFTGWDSIITGDDRLLRVNMLLNRGSRYLDVHSHLPHEGRVDLLVKTDCRQIRVRLPEASGYTRVRVSRQRGHGESTEMDGREVGAWSPDGYLSLTGAVAGERVRIDFPLARATTVEDAQGRQFETDWRGDDVVAIRPPGQIRPMYSERLVLDEAGSRSFDLHVPADGFPL